MSEKIPKPEELANVDFHPPEKDWMDTPVEFRKGTYNYPAAKKNVDYLGFPTRTTGPRRTTTGSCPRTGRRFPERG